jgi:hypothetical protein
MRLCPKQLAYDNHEFVMLADDRISMMGFNTL